MKSYFCFLCLLIFFGQSLAEQPSIPDATRNFTEIITSKGYPCETHKVTTQDGYILTAFRMPFGRAGASSTPRPPVILQHGLLDSSFTWIMNLPHQSLSYILSDNGYDVWMTNNRGNIYSKAHTTIPVDSNAFWAFSWDQMGEYDLPAFIDYVKNQTGFDKVTYVGHSEGTTQVFSGLSENPQLAESLASFVGFGPVNHVTNIGNIGIKDLADLDADEFLYYFDRRSFGEIPDKYKPLLADFCRECPLCCEDVIEWLCGKHNGVMNATRMQVMATHEPGGTSTQNVVHWGQMIRKGSFSRFDYGEIGNLRHYGTRHPPAYDMSKWPTQLPTALWSGSHDLLADPTDVANLIKQLPNSTYHKEMKDYAHLDFVWDIYAYQQMYPDVLSFISKHL